MNSLARAGRSPVRALLGLLAVLATIPAARSAAQTPDHPIEGPTVFHKGVVATDHEIASRAGLEVLQAGGNAVDAAVAASFTLSVVRCYSCGLGGGGFMLIHFNQDPIYGTLDTAINYREQAPACATPDFYQADPDPEAAVYGGKAVAVPGTVAGLLYAHEKFGRLDRSRVLAPAIRAAREGFAADEHYVASAAEVIDYFKRNPDAQGHKTSRFAFVWDRFLKKGQVKAGDRITLPEQAAALELVARDGPAAFTTGPIARAIVAAVQADGGCLTLDDLAAFKVTETPPLRTTFRGRTILGMPPPSSGGLVIAQVLSMLTARERDLAPLEHNTAPYIHLVAEAAQFAFADRARWLGDPAFVDVPVARLLDPDYLRRRAQRISLNRTFDQSYYGEPAIAPPDGGTSHLSVIDARGNAVACTETVNLVFGSLLAVPDYGFILNNEMDDFLTRRGVVNAFELEQSERNLPAPGKRPLSSMTPLIALEKTAAGQRVLLVAGASGGPRIISSTLQVALNVFLFDMDAPRAVAAPRFHHQWRPDELQLEDPLMDSPAEEHLRKLGHTTERKDLIGAVQLIRAAPAGGYQAASDPRKGGKPAGW